MSLKAQVWELEGSEVLGDRLEFAECLPRRLGRFADGVVEAMIDVVVNQLLLRRRDGTLDCVQLLRHIQAGPIVRQHRDHVLKVAAGTLEPLGHRVVRGVEVG